MLVGIVMLPLYIKYMGAEAYGLVGFFTMLQAFFGLMDLGLTPTIARETARYRAGVLTALEYRQLFRALSMIFAIIAIVGGGGLYLTSETVATHWLNVGRLPLDVVMLSLQIMAISVALRWMCGLYRGVVTGSEHLVWLSGFSALVATLRFIVVLPVMWYFGFTPFVFFVYQLQIALIEIVVLVFKSRKLLPPGDKLDQAIGWSFRPVTTVLKFALTIAFTSAVWVLVTQTDKLVISGILPLEEYGYFTLAVLVASGIMVIGGPISSAIMPRMARLHAEGKNEELIRVYRNSTQLVSVIAGSAAITLALCAEHLLFAWTGDQLLAVKAAPILQLYSIGNGFLAVAAFPYYLQYAKGDLRLHLVGSLAMVLVLIPCIVLSAIHYGGVGAGYVWVIVNALYLLIWVGVVHSRFESGLHFNWLLEDVLAVVLPATLIGSFSVLFDLTTHARIASLFTVLGVGAVVLVIAALCSSFLRKLFKEKNMGKVANDFND
jgi:O-antigen/teichoic acid export membrane protein